jgi:hypothetical protein
MLKLMLGMSFTGSGLKGFQQLLEFNIIPVSRAAQKENRVVK